MPLILSGNVASATADAGYTVANSCRFNDGDSAQAKKDTTSSDSIVDATISMWVKRGTLGTAQVLLAGNYKSNNNYYCSLSFTSGDALSFKNYDNATNCELITTRLFRDCSAWYYICVECDLSDAEADRVKIYINGTTRETSFSTTTNMTGDQFLLGKSGYEVGVGALQDASYFDGYMAEVCYVDGNAAGSPLTPSSFGEFDEDSPTIWKPKDVSGLSFGANGFYLDFEDSSNLGNDANGGTDLTESNLAAADQATDTPTNNFVTLNPLIRWGTNNSEFKEGNLVYDDSRGDWRSAIATFGATSGKWYWEMKLGGGTYHQVGIVGTTSPTSAQNLIDQTAVHGGYSFYNTNGDLQARTDNSAISGWDTSTLGTTAETDDILQVALDMDNKFLYFGKNGTFLKSGDPTSGATGTGGINISADYTSGVVAIPGVTMYDSSDGSLNFGSPAFTISSGNADADGYGNFEYAVPSGYYALCTKNLAEYG
jgi:hypothetical protein